MKVAEEQRQQEAEAVDMTAADATAVDMSAADMTGAMVPNFRRLAPNILIAGVLPAVAFGFLRAHVDSDATALAAVMIFPVAEISWERRRAGRFEPIGVIALVGILLGIIGALAFNGNATLLKVRESTITGVFGLICLGSLPARRPAMWFMGKAFATGGDPDKVAAFELIWDLPGTPRRFRIVTLVWGVGLVGEAVVRAILAFTISTQTFLVASLIINLGVLGVLFAFTIRYSRSAEEQTRARMADEGIVIPGLTDLPGFAAPEA